MQQLELPFHVSVDSTELAPVYTIAIDLDEESCLTLMWDLTDSDPRVICHETGPDLNVVTLYGDMIEADAHLRELVIPLALELEDCVEYELALQRAQERAEERAKLDPNAGTPIRLVRSA